MSGNRGCLANSLLFLVIVFLPLIGHIIETVWIFEDDHSPIGTILWLLIVWAIPFVGPFMYLLFGQRHPKYGRVMFGQPSYAYQQQQQRGW
ncbi:PLDc_N domain-containing protein [Ktedonosporobacter rubrisoli]|uniref:PLDc_N domain-containing protein n=1 Tax=Ktedonosporobacter rubrisoli TaxID=2509675 RepID=A0A4P6JUD2_KTERU|nr:PLDc N-terminal domain-containing protein [Ktedonosporobacter rubrisoli]QBD79239.1 PLDc_N domain-containing protein [Ktedonosporobacter rubrisoli]